MANLKYPALTPILVQDVKDHAMANYEKGWDTVVECYDNDDIIEIIKDCTTKKGAIKKMAAHIGPYNDYKADIEATAF